MDIERNRAMHDALSTDLQIVLIHLLNRALQEGGVADKDQRLRICERFSESAGEFIDQGWFSSEETDGKKIYPLLCFAERGDWTDTEAGEVLKSVAPDPTSFLYESFSESCEWYFDEQQETLGNIATGSA